MSDGWGGGVRVAAFWCRGAQQWNGRKEKPAGALRVQLLLLYGDLGAMYACCGAVRWRGQGPGMCRCL